MRTVEAIIPQECPCIDVFDDVAQAVRVCRSCGSFVGITVYVNDYKGSRGVRRNYQPYKRLNHFIKSLNSIRKKHRMVIPQTILHFVRRKCKIISSNNIRNILKASRLTKYIPYVNLMYETLSGRPVPHLFIADFNEVVRLFKEIDGRYNNIQKNRIQFFNYSFLIRKLLQKIGRDDCAEFYKPLKNHARYEYQCKLYDRVVNQVLP